MLAPGFERKKGENSDAKLDSSEPGKNHHLTLMKRGRSPVPIRRLGNYVLLEVLSPDGGMGVVYRALHDRLKVPRAVKVLKADVVRSKNGLSRFHREIEIVAKLDHPNIVKAYDAGEANGEHYLVMELLDGVNLSRVLLKQGALTTPDACELVRQVALGLQHAYEHGLVHRDIKPSNLMLTRSGTLKVVDLGLARLAEREVGDDSLTAPNEIIGTLDYMAPEQGLIDGPVDIRSDIYSLGCTLYKLLTGEPPFSGPEFDTARKKLRGHAYAPPRPITELRSDLPVDLVKLLHRLIAKSPDDRIATPAKVAELIQPFCIGSDLAQLAAASIPQKSSAASFQLLPTEGSPLSTTCGTTGFVELDDLITEPDTGLGTTEQSATEVLGGNGAFHIVKPSPLFLGGEFERTGGTTTRLRRLIEEGWKYCMQLSTLERVLSLTALLVLSVSLAGALLYFIRSKPTVSGVITSSTTPTPGVVYPLLREGNPHAVRWSTPVRNSQWHHNRDAESLQISSADYAIISLGDSWDTRKYDFEVSIYQNQWTSEVGLFFGWHPGREDNVDFSRFQAIKVRKDPDRPGEFRLVRSSELMVAPSNSMQGRDFAFGSIPRPDVNEEHRLAITVGEKGLESVRWDGNEIPGLADPVNTLQAQLTDADYRGLFGVVAEATSAVFRKAGYLQYPAESAPATKRTP